MAHPVLSCCVFFVDLDLMMKNTPFEQVYTLTLEQMSLKLFDNFLNDSGHRLVYYLEMTRENTDSVKTFCFWWELANAESEFEVGVSTRVADIWAVSFLMQKWGRVCIRGWLVTLLGFCHYLLLLTPTETPHNFSRQLPTVTEGEQSIFLSRKITTSKKYGKIKMLFFSVLRIY